MSRALRSVLVLVALLVPTVALAGRIFQWTDDKGSVRVTDNLWELPEPVREKYLALIEDEARKKFTPAQIRALKEAGNWPPLELIRPPALKDKGPLTEWMGFQIIGNDVDVYRQMNDEFRFQWDSLHQERTRLQQAVTQAKAAVAAGEEELQRVQYDDQVNGRYGEHALAPKAAKGLDKLRQVLTELQAQETGLTAKERDLALGKRAFFHPGEDGGPAGFGYLSR